MRTVLSTTARARALALALAVGVTGAAALPASAVSHETTSKHRSGLASTGGHVGKGSASAGAVRLGPAVKYVRHADGTVRRVR